MCLQWIYSWDSSDGEFFFPSILVIEAGKMSDVGVNGTFYLQIYSILLGLGWLLFISAFIVFPIRERLSNAKQVLNTLIS